MCRVLVEDPALAVVVVDLEVVLVVQVLHQVQVFLKTLEFHSFGLLNL